VETFFDVQEFTLNKQAKVFFVITDVEGNPAIVEKLTLFAYRPSNSKQDFSVPMTKSTDKLIDAKQTYQADITFPSKGKWDLLASVIINGIEVNYAQKIFVKD